MAKFTVGDDAPALTGTVNADLTGATVELHLLKPDRTVLTVAADVTDEAGGAWSYAWADGDLDQSGGWQVEAQVTFSSGRVQTFGPERFNVDPQIA